jgi:hypothetical protein
MIDLNLFGEPPILVWTPCRVRATFLGRSKFSEPKVCYILVTDALAQLLGQLDPNKNGRSLFAIYLKLFQNKN